MNENNKVDLDDDLYGNDENKTLNKLKSFLQCHDCEYFSMLEACDRTILWCWEDNLLCYEADKCPYKKKKEV
ncbi:MAG: hypothetical protein DRI44_02630 [Chlamydiae bacterium]|nr:MAG: hypothetical protein DRI44_02630 [Chlamydiota bacterium]